jgi:hypothetical protein
VIPFLDDYYRLPEGVLAKIQIEPLTGEAGFFGFGSDAVCYGQNDLGVSADLNGVDWRAASKSVAFRDYGVHLSFNPAQVIDNLRQERYVKSLEDRRHRLVDQPLIRSTYYGIRDLLPVSIRKHLQRVYLADWRGLSFPKWPVDFTVDSIHEEVLRLLMEAGGVQRIPFVWFWPLGAPNCLIMTHDVESAVGRDFTATLMDIDDSHGIKASFQVIPEKRYKVTNEYICCMKSRGFELDIHDLNHDGHLYQERELFLRRAKQINEYAKRFDAKGFRAGVMYRNLEWYDAYEFSYDMSVPNVAHLDPQRGGCCTVFPYFVGRILEIPLTTCQDYTLFQILNEFSTNLWEKQLELIRNRNGLMSFVAHPDYLVDRHARSVYESLLAHLRQLVERDKVWMALPGELDQWWRARSEMSVVPRGNEWEIVGPQKELARLAYAVSDGKRVRYELQPLR